MTACVRRALTEPTHPWSPCCGDLGACVEVQGVARSIALPWAPRCSAGGRVVSSACVILVGLSPRVLAPYLARSPSSSQIPPGAGLTTAILKLAFNAKRPRKRWELAKVPPDSWPAGHYGRLANSAGVFVRSSAARLLCSFNAIDLVLAGWFAMFSRVACFAITGGLSVRRPRLVPILLSDAPVASGFTPHPADIAGAAKTHTAKAVDHPVDVPHGAAGMVRSQRLRGLAKNPA